MAKYFNYFELISSHPDKITLENGQDVFIKKARDSGRSPVLIWKVVDGKEESYSGTPAKVREVLARWENGESYGRTLRGMECMTGVARSHSAELQAKKKPRGLQAIVKADMQNRGLCE